MKKLKRNNFYVWGREIKNKSKQLMENHGEDTCASAREGRGGNSGAGEESG